MQRRRSKSVNSPLDGSVYNPQKAEKVNVDTDFDAFLKGKEFSVIKFLETQKQLQKMSKGLLAMTLTKAEIEQYKKKQIANYKQQEVFEHRRISLKFIVGRAEERLKTKLNKRSNYESIIFERSGRESKIKVPTITSRGLKVQRIF